MQIGIVVNYSYGGLAKSADSIAEELSNLGCSACIVTNKDVLDERRHFDFEKCVFLDKDVVCGMSLELSGVRLYNSIGAIEACDDKRITYELLKGDFPMPDTVCFPLTFANADVDPFKEYVASRLGFPLVAKEAFGSLGMQVMLLNDEDELGSYMRSHIYVPHLYQRFVSSSRGRDVRVYVVGGRAVAAMSRTSRDDFRSNSALGSAAERFDISSDLAETAVSVASQLGLDFCGIDFLIDKTGQFLVCEVNSNAMFSTLSKISGVNIAAEIARLVAEDKVLGNLESIF